MIEIFNRQKIIELNPQDFQSFTVAAVAIIPENYKESLSIAFVTDEVIKELNFQFRRKNSVTDVLSFPDQPDEFETNVDSLGDIVISIPQAEKQAVENKLSLELEIKQLILHGILHLCGFDHETDDGEMNELELKLRTKLDI